MAPVEYVDFPVYHDELASALGFAPADLEANRAGCLTASERDFQLRPVRNTVLITAVFLLLAAGCVALVFTVGIGTGISTPSLVLAAVFLLTVGLLGYSSIPVWRDLRAGLVSTVEGMVRPAERETDIATRGGGRVPVFTYYWVVDDQQRFTVTGKAYGVLTPARHRLYFLPRSRRVVAAERVRTAG